MCFKCACLKYTVLCTKDRWGHGSNKTLIYSFSWSQRCGLRVGSQSHTANTPGSKSITGDIDFCFWHESPCSSENNGKLLEVKLPSKPQTAGCGCRVLYRTGNLCFSLSLLSSSTTLVPLVNSRQSNLLPNRLFAELEAYYVRIAKFGSLSPEPQMAPQKKGWQ